jgi:hypothetical protein
VQKYRYLTNYKEAKLLKAVDEINEEMKEEYGIRE